MTLLRAMCLGFFTTIENGRRSGGAKRALGRELAGVAIIAVPSAPTGVAVRAFIASTERLPVGVHGHRAALGRPQSRADPDQTGRGCLEAFALKPLTLQLPGATHGFRGFTSPALRRFLIMPPKLHFAENPLPLHLLL